MRYGPLQGTVRRALQLRLPLAVFAAAHFVLVVLGAQAIALDGAPIGPLRSVITLYANAAGLDGSYAFFSPNVGDQTIAYVETASPALGRRHIVVGGVTSEADLRFTNFVGFMADMNQRHLLARLIAVRTLALDRTATSAAVAIGTYRMPSMREYRAGRRPFMQREFFSEFHVRAKGTR